MMVLVRGSHHREVHKKIGQFHSCDSDAYSNHVIRKNNLGIYGAEPQRTCHMIAQSCISIQMFDVP